MPNRLVSVDDNLHLPAAVRAQLKSDVEADVAGSVSAAQTAASNAATSASAASGSAQSASASASAAQAAANSATAPTDVQVAALVNTAASSTRTALDAIYTTPSELADLPTKEYVDTAVSTLQDQVVIGEDLFLAVLRETTIPTGTNTTIPLFIAPYPLRLTSLSLSSFQASATVTANDTNWWLTRVRYTRPSVSTSAVNIATKTTRATAGAEPAGETISPIKAWSYGQANLTDTLVQAGDIVSMIFAPQGTPTVITGPLTITVGYKPE